MSKSLFINDGDVLAASFISAIAIAVGEWLFHKYLDRHVFDEKHAHSRIE
ncbi:YndM family protein [Domibacillus indicus]|nr:YndM family protein [Domibacillus indicus]